MTDGDILISSDSLFHSTHAAYEMIGHYIMLSMLFQRISNQKL